MLLCTRLKTTNLAADASSRGQSPKKGCTGSFALVSTVDMLARTTYRSSLDRLSSIASGVDSQAMLRPQLLHHLVFNPQKEGHTMRRGQAW